MLNSLSSLKPSLEQQEFQVFREFLESCRILHSHLPDEHAQHHGLVVQPQHLREPPVELPKKTMEKRFPNCQENWEFSPKIQFSLSGEGDAVGFSHWVDPIHHNPDFFPDFFSFFFVLAAQLGTKGGGFGFSQENSLKKWDRNVLHLQTQPGLEWISLEFSAVPKSLGKDLTPIQFLLQEGTEANPRATFPFFF